MLIIAGVPEGGVTTLTDVSLMETDRLLRDFVSIEEAQPSRAGNGKHRSDDVRRFEGRNRRHVLPSLIRKYPNVYVLPRSQRHRSSQAAAQAKFATMNGS